MILLVDNYDSFVFNLARYFERLGQETVVVRNDAITVDEVLAHAARLRSSFRRAPARPSRPAARWSWSAGWAIGCRFWESAWDIKRWAWRWGDEWCGPRAGPRPPLADLSRRRRNLCRLAQSDARLPVSFADCRARRRCPTVSR